MKNKAVTVLMIMLVSIALIGVVAVILVKQLTGSAAEEEPNIDEIVEASVDIPEITTNLAGGGFVRLSLKIQTDSKEAAEELMKRDFQVKNLVITELSELKAENLEGKAGKEQFQQLLLTQLNELLQAGQVEKVYITSYVIQ